MGYKMFVNIYILTIIGYIDCFSI